MKKNSKDLIILLLMITIVFGIIGYASLYQKIVNGIGIQKKAWDISLNNIKSDVSGDAILKSEEINNMYFKSNVIFKTLNDKIIYRYDIYNKGNIDARLNNILVSCDKNIKYKISGIIKGSVLTIGGIDEIIIEVFPENKEAINFDQNIEVYLEYVEVK